MRNYTLSRYAYRVGMLGSDTVGGTCLAHNLREAQGKAVTHFEQSNDIEPIGTMAERIKFYAPTVILQK